MTDMATAETTSWFRRRYLLRLVSAGTYLAAVLSLFVIAVPVSIAAFGFLLALGVISTWYLLRSRCPACGKSFSGKYSLGFWPPVESFRGACAACGASIAKSRHYAG